MTLPAFFSAVLGASGPWCLVKDGPRARVFNNTRHGRPPGLYLFLVTASGWTEGGQIPDARYRRA